MKDIQRQKQDGAVKRIETIKRFEEFAAKFKYGRCKAYEQFALLNKIPKRTLQRWTQHYRKFGPAGLIDMRGGTKGRGARREDIFVAFGADEKTRERVRRYCLCHIGTISASIVELTDSIIELESHPERNPSARERTLALANQLVIEDLHYIEQALKDLRTLEGKGSQV